MGACAGPSSLPSSWNQTTPDLGLQGRRLAGPLAEALRVDLLLLPERRLHPHAGGRPRRAGRLLDADYVWHNSYSFYTSRGPQHQAGLTASGFFDTGALSTS